MSKWICPNCDYIYDDAKGHPREGWPPGTNFMGIESDWPCPDCGVCEQMDFIVFESSDRPTNQEGSA